MLAEIGRIFLSLCLSTGQLTKFSGRAICGILYREYDKRSIISQMMFVGFYSLPVIGMTALFSGAVLALQGYDGFSRFSAQGSIATIVVLSITRELGPVLAGLMISGRVGAAMAAEIATMRVTEQIDALYTLSTEPVRYLVTPRLISCVLMLPCLVLIGDILGVLGGYLVSVYKLEFNSSYYILNTFKNLKAIDVISGLVKATIFGFIIAIIACYSGYRADKGAQGVGKATTAAVVNSSILILFANYFLTELFFSR